MGLFLRGGSGHARDKADKLTAQAELIECGSERAERCEQVGSKWWVGINWWGVWVAGEAQRVAVLLSPRSIRVGVGCVRGQCVHPSCVTRASLGSWQLSVSESDKCNTVSETYTSYYVSLTVS